MQKDAAMEGAFAESCILRNRKNAADLKRNMETLYKTIYQYNQKPVAPADMERMQEIARDCRTVRNYVYERYGGIGSLPKIYPGYTVQNEMTKSGLRERLGLPSVYFYLSIFDALGDIKSQWARAKGRIEKNIRDNENLAPEDRHYLRFVMKQSQCFEAILLGGKPVLTENWKGRYAEVSSGVDMHRLDHYLRRQVRRHLKTPHTDTADGFTISPKGYRYGDHGIYLSTKESRKRIFIPLTDNNRYARQLYIRLYPDEERITINVPVELRQRHPAGYAGERGLAMGLRCMFVTDQGGVYGEKYMEYQQALADYIREKLSRRRKHAKSNPGMKKYSAKKARLEAAMHAYVNAEINRMLDTEKPGVLYIPKLPATSRAGVSKKINATVSMWQRGYIKSRLIQKCQERSIELTEVFGRGISRECSVCGAEGIKEGENFYCRSCGICLSERKNAAANALKRGRAQNREKVHDEGFCG